MPRVARAPARLLAVVSAVLLGVPAERAAAGTDPGGAWPLAPRPPIVHGFEPPASAYGSGHRGLDLLGRAGQPVYAARAGRVTFAGQLAGRGVVVVDDGSTRTTYEPVTALVHRGDEVPAGATVGTLAGTSAIGSHCWPRLCLHLGWIRDVDDVYLDPSALFGVTRVRLLPLEGHLAPGGPAPAGVAARSVPVIAVVRRAVTLASSAGMGLLVGAA